MTFEEFVRTVADWRARLAPEYAARAIDNLPQMRLVELPRGEILEVALLLAMVLLAKKEGAPISEERPLVVTKSEAVAVVPRDSGNTDPAPNEPHRYAEKRARALLQRRLKDGPKPGAEIEAPRLPSSPSLR